MSTIALRWAIPAVAALAASALGLGWMIGRSPEDSQFGAVSPPLAGRPECPHDWDFKRGQIPLVGSVINVPELHDCQRFIVYEREQFRYHALYAVFAAADLNALDTTATDSVRAAAEIYAEGRYPQLGITRPFSCLYLFRKDQTPGSTWLAVMVPVADAQVDCRKRVNPRTITGATALDVRRTPVQGFGGNDYPPVARWDWDRQNRVQYLGIKCGTAWCEVGPPGFTPAAASPDPTGPPKLRRTRMIKGWYDQQFLATEVGGQTRPSRIRGTIYPDSGLGDYSTVNAFTTGKWVRVAEIALEAPSGEPNPYQSSMNLDVTLPGGKLNQMHLCRGTRGECGVGTTAVCDGDGTWWSRITSVAGLQVFRCVTRRAHDNLEFTVPGTARWRWLASDETTWKRCDNGCCEVN